MLAWQKSLSPDYDAIRTVVTAVVEPLPEERSHTSFKHVKTKAHKTTTRKDHVIDFDAIEVCSPSLDINRNYGEALKRKITVTRTLTDLNRNAGNKINQQQKPVNIIRNYNKPELKVDQISLLEKNVQNKKRKNIRTEQENLLDYKNKKTAKDQKMQNLKSSERPKQLRIKDYGSLNKNLRSHASKLLNKNKLPELQVGKLETLTKNTYTSSANSSKSTVLIPIQETGKELKLKDEYSLENKNIIKDSTSLVDKNHSSCVEHLKSLTKKDLLTESLTVPQKDAAVVLISLGEAALLSHANNVTLLLETFKKLPNNPSLYSLHNVLQHLNSKLSTYFKT